MTKTADLRPSIALFAYSQPGFACLDELLKTGANIAAVFTHIDPEDEEIWFDSVYDLAKKNNIPVYQSKKVDEPALAFFRQAAPEIILSAYYRAIIPDEFLAAARLGAYNLHGSLLPKYRGRACINWAVLRGETETGVTLHVMTAKADQGDIIAQESFPITFTDTAYDIFLKASTSVRKIIRDFLPLIENNTAPRRPQIEEQATKFGRRQPSDGLIDWTNDAAAIYNLIRSVTHPFPGAFTFFNDKKLFIWQVALLTEQELSARFILPLPAKAGTVINASGSVCVKCGSGGLLLKTVSWAGEKDSTSADSTFAIAFTNGSCLG